MNRLILPALLLAAACAPYQPMQTTWIPVSATAAPHDQALNECRFLVSKDPLTVDWFTIDSGTPMNGPDGALLALNDHGQAQMQRCMQIHGYRPGPLVPYRG